MNRKPPELHVLDGTKSRAGKAVDLPDSIKARIPKAYWYDNPDMWDADRFISETSEYLFNVYGIGSEQDQHTLAMLAEQIDLYVKCSKALRSTGLISQSNGGKTFGPNPIISIRKDALKLAIHLMNELGLTPRSRLAAGKTEDESPLSKFLAGPLAQ